MVGPNILHSISVEALGAGPHQAPGQGQKLGGGGIFRHTTDTLMPFFGSRANDKAT